MTAVSVLTGFLGSGKTTLLRHLLRDPWMGRVAVIMNEFGAVGIDHDLLETSNEDYVQLTNGCLCCRVRSDLVLTLRELADKRARERIPDFDHVVIETSGLAEPAPILQALMTDPDVSASYRLGTVVATVDSVNGLSTLDRFAQSVRQVALADSLLMTKVDLPQSRPSALQERLSRLNPRATMLIGAHGRVRAEALFGQRDVAGIGASQTRIDGSPVAGIPGDDAGGDHNQGITSFCLVRDAPIRAATVALLLEALADNCGPDLLRVKGILNVLEHGEAPAIIHGVQHVFHPLEWLERWPSDDRRTRIVFIVQGIRESWVRSLMELLEGEVAAETVRQRR